MTPERKLAALFAAEAPPARDFAFQAAVARRIAARRAWMTVVALLPWTIAATALLWADAVGARAGALRTLQRGQRHAMRVTEFKTRGRTVVALREVAGLAHAWSGGVAQLPFSDPAGPDASALVWAFVARQFAKK